MDNDRLKRFLSRLRKADEMREAGFSEKEIQDKTGIVTFHGRLEEVLGYRDGHTVICSECSDENVESNFDEIVTTGHADGTRLFCDRCHKEIEIIVGS